MTKNQKSITDIAAKMRPDELADCISSLAALLAEKLKRKKLTQDEIKKHPLYQL
jgi:hypothetical protein